MINGSEKIENILVTGGAGYIGSRVVELLINNNYKVIVLDNLTFGSDGLLKVWHHPNFKFIKVDITKADELKRIFNKYRINAVVHLAAIVGDPACAKLPKLAIKTNWKASVDLLDFSIKNRVKKFIFASTCSNYGRMANRASFVDEKSLLNPVSLYAELKVKLENLVLKELKKDEIFCPIILRFATAYGVSARMRFDLTVNEFTKELALGRELKVFGKQFWRPYCHVDDLARAVSLVLNSKKEKVSFNVFNVGDTNENYQKRMIVEEIKKIIPAAKVKYINKDEDPRDYRVSFKKISKELGFSITKRLPDGIKEIKKIIDKKVILDPDDPKYRNI